MPSSNHGLHVFLPSLLRANVHRIVQMDTNYRLCMAPDIPFESMDFLSRNSAVQVFRTLAAGEENTMHMGNGSLNCPWNTEDLRSWIWLQQTIHPELNLHQCLRKQWIQKLPNIFNGQSIKMWLKETKRKRKEETRLQKAEAHAAVSVAGVAAALAAVAAENVRKKSDSEDKPEGKNEEDVHKSTDSILASAAALVAAQCMEMAQTMGAKRGQLSSVIGSALTAKDARDIITLTAAAATSIRGAAALRARAETCRTSPKEGGNSLLQLLKDSDKEIKDETMGQQDVIGFDYLKGRNLLACGAYLTVITENGKSKLRLVSVALDKEAKVILRSRSTNTFNLFAVAKESIIQELHSWAEEDWTEKEDPTHFIVIKTSRGIIKLKMNDYSSCKMWSMTINHMLMLSTSYGGCELHY